MKSFTLFAVILPSKKMRTLFSFLPERSTHCWERSVNYNTGGFPKVQQEVPAWRLRANSWYTLRSDLIHGEIFPWVFLLKVPTPSCWVPWIAEFIYSQNKRLLINLDSSAFPLWWNGWWILAWSMEKNNLGKHNFTVSSHIVDGQRSLLCSSLQLRKDFVFSFIDYNLSKHCWIKLGLIK